jgi:flagellar motor switch protein FliM
MSTTSSPHAEPPVATERSRTGGPSRRRRGEPRPFDFRRQNKLSREHVRTMQIVQETFARGFSTMLASHLRSVTQVSITSIEQQSYDEYVRELPNPTLLTLLNLPPLSGAAIFQLPLDVAYCAVELLLGGKGYAEQPTRAFTDLELLLTRGIIERALPDLRYALEPVVATEPKVMSQESNPQFAQIAAPTDMVIVVSYDIRLEGISGRATMCIPFSSLQPHLEALSATSLYASQSAGDAAESRRRLEHHLAEVPVGVAAAFRPVVLSAEDIDRLAVGDVLLLSHPVEEPLTLSVDGIATFEGGIGRRNRRLAVRIDGPADPSTPTSRPVRGRVIAPG